MGDGGGGGFGLPDPLFSLCRLAHFPCRQGGTGHAGGVLYPAGVFVGVPVGHPLGYCGADGDAGDVGSAVGGAVQPGWQAAGICPSLPLFLAQDAAAHLFARSALPLFRRTADGFWLGLEIRRGGGGHLPAGPSHRFPSPAGQAGAGDGGPVRLDPHHYYTVPVAGGLAPQGTGGGKLEVIQVQNLQAG